MPRQIFKPSTTYLTDKQAMAIGLLAETAFNQGIALNRHGTIHMAGTKAESHPQQFLTSLTDQTRKWLKRQGLDHGFVWVLEHGVVKGLHAHVLLHIPATYQVRFRKQIAVWASRWGVTNIMLKTIKYPPHWAKLHPLNNIHKVTRYLRKGMLDGKLAIDMAVCTRPQGRIYGRRMGTNIKV